MSSITIVLSGWVLWSMITIAGIYTLSSVLEAYLSHLKLKLEKLKRL